MNLKSNKIDNVIIIYLPEKLDVSFFDYGEKELNRIIKEDPTAHILFNLQDVEYVNSYGMRRFVSVMRKLKESKSKHALCNLKDNIKRIFEVVDIINLFNIYESEEKAINSLKN